MAPDSLTIFLHTLSKFQKELKFYYRILSCLNFDMLVHFFLGKTGKKMRCIVFSQPTCLNFTFSFCLGFDMAIYRPFLNSNYVYIVYIYIYKSSVEKKLRSEGKIQPKDAWTSLLNPTPRFRSKYLESLIWGRWAGWISSDNASMPAMLACLCSELVIKVWSFLAGEKGTECITGGPSHQKIQTRHTLAQTWDELQIICLMLMQDIWWGGKCGTHCAACIALRNDFLRVQNTS